MFTVSLYCVSALHAVRTHRKLVSGFETMSAGELQNVSLSNMGYLSKAKMLEKITDVSGADAIWDATVDKKGNVYIATGAESVIYRLSKGGELEKYFEPGKILTHAVAVGPDGALYVGTSPNGVVYRIADGENPEIFYDPSETYIWDLIFDENGGLFIATGGEARVYYLPANSKPGDEAVLWLESDRDHINTLALDDNGHLLAGSTGGAYLYRVTEAGKFDLLCSGYGNEITAIHAKGSAVYFSTYGPSKHDANGSTKDVSNTTSKTTAVKKTIPVYRWNADGFVDRLTHFPQSNVYSFAPDHSGGWFVGSETAGKLYHFNSLNDWSVLQQAEGGGQISSILSVDEGEAYVFTSNPAAIYRYGSKSDDAIYTGEIVDAGQEAIWGKLRPLYAHYGKSSVSWETRSGNAKEPDSSWSEWEELKGMKVKSPNGRYLQYRVYLKDKRVQLKQLECFYRFRNKAPEIHQIHTFPVGVKAIELKPNKTPITMDSITKGTYKGHLISQPVRQQLMLTGTKGHRTIGWQVSDPNADAMRYQLSLRKESDDESEPWVLLSNDMSAPIHSFKTTGFDQGYYRVKVTAHDYISNMAGEGLSTDKVSDVFLIDNSAPEIAYELDKKDDVFRLQFKARDQYGVISHASYVLNGSEAIPLLPVDGLFDSQNEVFELELKKSEAPISLIFELRDSAGNFATKQLSL